MQTARYCTPQDADAIAIALKSEDDEEDDFARYLRLSRSPMGAARASGGCSVASASSSRSGSQRSSGTHSVSTIAARTRASLNEKLLRKWQTAKRKLVLSKSKSEDCSSSTLERTRSAHANGYSGRPHDKLTAECSGTAPSSAGSTGSTTLPSHAVGVHRGMAALMGDDSQSRDSGHSSGGGSPDLRNGFRRRRPWSFSGGTGGVGGRRDWFRQGAVDLPDLPDDQQSLGSYETAAAALGVTAEYDSAKRFPSALFDAAQSENVLPNSAATWSSPPEQLQPRIEARRPQTMHLHESQPAQYQSRRGPLDVCSEEFDYMATSAFSPVKVRRKFAGNEEVRVQTRTSAGESQASESPRFDRRLFHLCSYLYFVVRAILMISSCLLLLLLFFFVWRSGRCETDRSVTFHLGQLQRALDESLFGQHIAKQTVMQALSEHANGDHAVLVLLLVGWLGSGKTHLASLIREHFPVQDNVHSFSVPLHFARESNNFRFLDDLSLHIGRSCGHSMVIFDDIDAGGAEVQRKVADFILTLKNSRLSSRSNGSVVVVTSNAGGSVINAYALAERSRRERLTVEEVLRQLDAERVVVPMRTLLAAHSGVSVRTVPFLPMGDEHVRACVRREIRSHGLEATGRDIDAVMHEVAFSPEEPALSRSGCKLIASKVDVLLGSQNPYVIE